jgi:hypothetical protein
MYVSSYTGSRPPKGLLAFLGAVDDSAIIASICPSGVGKSPCTTVSTAQFKAFLQSAIDARMLPAYTTATGASSASACSGYSNTGSSLITGANVAKASTGAATNITSSLVSSGVIDATGALATAIPVVGTIVGLITSVIGIFGAHHAAAVKDQDAVLCQGVPAVNNVLATIDQGLASGSLATSDASSQYSSLLTQFTAAVKADPSFKMGDALYGYMLALQAVIAARIQDLQNGVLTGGAPIPTASATGSVASSISSVFSGSLTPWLVLAGLGLLFLL